MPSSVAMSLKSRDVALFTVTVLRDGDRPVYRMGSLACLRESRIARRVDIIVRTDDEGGVGVRRSERRATEARLFAANATATGAAVASCTVAPVANPSAI